MAKSKPARKVLRPSGAVVDDRLRKSFEDANAEQSSGALLGQIRPQDAGGEVNLAGADIMAVGAEFVDLGEELDTLEEAVGRLKTKIKAREDWLLEQMNMAGSQRFTVKGRSCGIPKTLAINNDYIVSKAKGITTEHLAGVLRAVGIGDIIGESVNGNTLKATVKQQMATAGIAGESGAGEKGYCRNCSTFYSLEAVGHECPQCSPPDQIDPSFAGEHIIMRTIDGIPAALKEILFVEKTQRIGVTKA